MFVGGVIQPSTANDSLQSEGADGSGRSRSARLRLVRVTRSCRVNVGGFGNRSLEAERRE